MKLPLSLFITSPSYTRKNSLENNLKAHLPGQILPTTYYSKKRRAKFHCCSFQTIITCISLLLTLCLITYIGIHRFYYGFDVFEQGNDLKDTNTSGPSTLLDQASIINKSQNDHNLKFMEQANNLEDKEDSRIQTYYTNIKAEISKNKKSIKNFDKNLSNIGENLKSTNESLGDMKSQLQQLTLNQANNLTKFNEILEKLHLELKALSGPDRTSVEQQPGPKGDQGLPGPIGPVGPAGPQGKPGLVITKNITQSNMSNCYHDKHEKLATSGVSFMTTGWIKPEKNFVFTGIACSTDGRKESFLEVSRVRATSSTNNESRKNMVKQFRCKCGGSPSSIPNKLKEPSSPNDSSTLTSCAIHYWACPI